MMGRMVEHLLRLLALVHVTYLCRGHVVLTFPPARKYALDFLDNARLPRTVCGMPKGLGPRTTILSGTTLNVTWSSGLPHQGGYKLEILDYLERPIMDLTPMVQGSKFLDFDPTIQRHRVTLPREFECTDCSIRLLRQATEWNPEFIMKSCADIDIIKDNYQEDCMKNGLYRDGRCYCHKTFSGGRCQHKDECFDDEDCGSHGSCVNIGGTNYPKKQCYCQLGWFGRKCDKESIYKSKDIKFDRYNSHDLSPDVKLYWQILHESSEIEVVMVAKTSSYVALGWRPLDITVVCKAFPDLSMPQMRNQVEFRKSKELNMTKSSTTSVSESASLSSSSSSTEQSKLIFSQSVEQTQISIEEVTPSPTEKVIQQETGTTPAKKNSATNSPKIRFPPRRPSLFHRTTTTSTIPPMTTTTEITTLTASSEEPKQKILMEVRSETSVQENSESETVTSSQEYTNSDEDPKAKILSASTEEVNPHSSERLEFSNEMDALASEEIEHISNVEVKSYGPDGGKSKRQANDEDSLHSNPFYPLVPLHPMDCTDIVIGSANGDLSRIEDYYTRDQSTPQLDSFWGGTNDLTSAMGFEANGSTIIMFRKSLQVSEKTDHSIFNTSMHVIWAKGQEGNMNIHQPSSSLEENMAAFYVTDELKYHGRGSQRGNTTINFYQETVKTTNNCRGEWKTPSTCIIDDCEYKTVWEYHPSTDDIHFTIFTNHTSTWTGIGFSRDQKMNNSDVVIGWVNDNGHFFMMDMWISGYFPPTVDSKQDIDNQAGQRNSSGSTLMFSRKRDTNDSKEDLAFTDTECLYLIFPYHGGWYNGINKKLKKHEKTPAISSNKICMQSCEYVPNIIPISASTVDDLLSSRFLPSTMASIPTTSSTSADEDSLAYSLLIRLPLQNNLPNVIIPDSEEIQRALKSKIQSEVSKVLQDVKGYKDVRVINVQRESNTTDSLLAKMNILVDESAFDKNNELTVEEAINSSISQGKVGLLQVDSTFYELLPPTVFEPKDEIMPSLVEASTDGNLIAIYAIIAAVSALGLLVITQIICTIYRCQKSKSTRVSKERLISNSGWKDYSTTASSNYSYEPFSSNYDESTGKVSKNPIGGSHSGSGSHKNGHVNSNASVGDSRSLSRQPRGENQDRNHYSRRSESLPRLNPSSHPPFRGGNNYATHDRAQRNGAHHRSQMELQPDFYFMPSQRRYTGEVVRVYVDYNNPNYTGK